MSELVRKVEAVLFAAAKRMTAEEISLILNDENKLEDINEALDKLGKEYEKPETSLSLSGADDNTWKITLKDQYLPFAEKLMPSTDLPKPVVETLAIIAWKNPILQSDLVKLRSAVVYEHIAELEKLHLITRTKQGRSYIVKVTERFYDYFDIPQSQAEEMFGEYEEPKEEEILQDNVFNKGDSFDESAEDKDKRLMEEIRNNKINPEEIINADKQFLEDFDKKLEEIEVQSGNATKTLKEIDKIEDEERQKVLGESQDNEGEEIPEPNNEGEETPVAEEVPKEDEENEENRN